MGWEVSLVCLFVCLMSGWVGEWVRNEGRLYDVI
jgi:hypothetical protein